MKSRLSISGMLEFLLVFLTILSTYSIPFILTPHAIYGLLILVISVYLFLTLSRYKKISSRVLCCISLYFISCFTLMVLGKGYVDTTFMANSLLFIVYVFFLGSYNNYDRVDKILNIYETVMFYIALVSLVFYFLGTVLRVIPSSGYIDSINWSRYYGYTNYYWLYFEGQSTPLFGHVFLRNMGLFSEGPVFSCLLTIALYLELFVCKKGKKYFLVILVAMLTTFSTTSLAVGTVLIFIDFYNRRLRNKKLIVILPVVLAVAGMVVLLVLLDKLQESNISGSTRMDDIKACFYSFLDSPLFGNGYQNIRALDPYRVSWRGSSSGNSTGIGGVFSNGGLVLGMWYTVPFFFAIKRFWSNKIYQKYYGLVILVFVIFFIMIIHFTGGGSLLLALQWLVICEDKKKKRHPQQIRL